MDIETLRQYCLSKKAVTKGLPFGDTVLVFKVAEKMFALTSLDTEGCRVSLKCDPERAIELREQHPDEIMGAYHMNKKHWNMVVGGPQNRDEELLGHKPFLVLADYLTKICKSLQPSIWKRLKKV